MRDDGEIVIPCGVNNIPANPRPATMSDDLHFDQDKGTVRVHGIIPGADDKAGGEGHCKRR